MKDVPPPKAGPRPPDESAPLSLEHTPAKFVVTSDYVKRKLEEAEAHVAQVAREAARAEHGRPVISRVLTPWFFAGFTLCGSVTTVAMSYEGVMPRWLLITAAVGAMFFGGMLGLGPGLRK